MESGYKKIIEYAAEIKNEILENYEAAKRDDRMQHLFMETANIQRIKLSGLYELAERIYNVPEEAFDEDLEMELHLLQRVA